MTLSSAFSFQRIVHRFSFSSAIAFHWCAVAAVSVLVLLGPLAAHAGEDPTLATRQLWQLLDYIAVDYPGAVVNGEISDAGEFREMGEFAGTVRARVQALPSRPQQTALTEQSERLLAAVNRHAPSVEVVRVARQLADQLLEAYPVPMAPRQLPDLKHGALLYQQQCAGC